MMCVIGGFEDSVAYNYSYRSHCCSFFTIFPDHITIRTSPISLVHTPRNRTFIECLDQASIQEPHPLSLSSSGR